MAVGKQIRTKIASVKSTQKITDAMEKVAASKMRTAQKLMDKTKPYAETILRVVGHVARSQAEYKHPYLVGHAQQQAVGIIVVSSDRGLCGGLNSQLFRAVVLQMQELSQQGKTVEICAIGRKAEAFFSRMGANVVASATQMGDHPSSEDLIGVVQSMLTRYDNGDLGHVYVAHNTFVNTMLQRPGVKQLLPIPSEDVTEEVRQGPWDYLYEPEAKSLLTALLVRYVEMRVYQAVVDNLACEQCARMLAMKNATDNAKDMIDTLSRMYNKARQAAITQEIAEIVSGAEAV